MSLTIFDEATYLAAYDDVRAAVEAGQFASGLDHFQRFGLAEGRTLVSPLYEEGFYLGRNPDVAAAVVDGRLASGLQHFLEFGEREGRRPGLLFDEKLYVDRHGDVEAAIASGLLESGLDHYVRFGRAEGRSGAELSEPTYRDIRFGFSGNDVQAAIARGEFFSGYDHYRQFGQFEAARTAPFYGTDDNDIITAFGLRTEISGVDLFGVLQVGRPTTIPGSFGEQDLLIGGAGRDDFLLGVVRVVGIAGVETPLYSRRGDADVATLQNFERGSDRIFLAGRAEDYDLATSPEGVRISRDGDLMAVVLGVPALEVVSESTSFAPPLNSVFLG